MNKAICSALSAAFLGYRLFRLATQLGVKFLDKFAKVVDYQSTFQAGYLKLHKLSIRMANFDLQMHSLMAFAPLFPATRKYRYTESEGKSLAHNESLETYGVKFLKKNLT
ncbi:15650_t:CDS:2, partial [Dentiscutata heterogama]